MMGWRRIIKRQLAKLAVLLITTIIMIILAEFVVRVFVSHGIARNNQFYGNLPMTGVQVHPFQDRIPTPALCYK